MKGCITKKQIFEIYKTYGLKVALAALTTKQRTWLGFMTEYGLI